ncbi:MAG: hypothetical protein WD294_07415 [Phycisphaeraceae bacterium]
MSAAIEILARLAAAGVWVIADGNEVVLRPARGLSRRLIEEVRSNKDEILESLRSGQYVEPLGGVSADDWVAGRNISVERIGFNRYYYGGRPHLLCSHLLRDWRAEYTSALLAGYPEPKAWDMAWAEVMQPIGRELWW